MDVFKGMEVPIEGQGFESGDQMMLRAETDLEATTEVSSSNLLTFTLPDEIEDGHTYKFVLLRGDDYQVLGASTLTVKLVINVELDETMSASWGAPAVIRGEGFRMTDVLVLDQAGGSHEITPSEVDDQSVTFIIPEASPRVRAPSRCAAARRPRSSARPNSSSRPRPSFPTRRA